MIGAGEKHAQQRRRHHKRTNHVPENSQPDNTSFEKRSEESNSPVLAVGSNVRKPAVLQTVAFPALFTPA